MFRRVQLNGIVHKFEQVAAILAALSREGDMEQLRNLHMIALLATTYIMIFNSQEHSLVINLEDLEGSFDNLLCSLV